MEMLIGLSVGLLFIAFILWLISPWIIIWIAILFIVIYIHNSAKFKRDQENQKILQLEAEQREKELQRKIAAVIEELQKEALFIIENNANILTRKANQLIYKDDYGNYVFKEWDRECDYFISNVLLKNIPDLFSYVDRVWIDEAITSTALNGGSNSNECLEINPSITSAIDFENYCASLLRESGWVARVTKPSNDQGVDIIAELGDIRAVFQCKLYSKPVGNSAVQEAIAGKQYEYADIAAVVTNNTFTKSARKLAATSGVYLLHFSELTDFLVGEITEINQKPR